MADSLFELSLREDVASFYDDPLAFVHFIFPWGVEGTPLAGETGPDTWQTELLTELGDAIRRDPLGAKRFAVASGHGIGKSTITSWIMLWAMSTRPMLSGVVTANTFSQLSTRTWRELGKWHQLSLNKHWFEIDAKKFYKQGDYPKNLWVVNAETNNEKNSEAFAGRHEKHVIQLYDEASAIPDVIWEVSEGATTDPRSMWFVFGNPTQNRGRFKSCFTTDRERWTTYKVDSRKSKLTNKKVLAEWAKAYGEDSDFFRVRVRGEFPRMDNTQFISQEAVERAEKNELPWEAYALAPKVLSMDVARGGDEKGARGDYGGDDNVICVRQGRKLLALEAFPGRGDTMKVVMQAQRAIKEHDPAAIFIDGDGLGIGVADRLRELGHNVTAVKSRKEPDKPEVYYDKRMEMWDRLRDWLEEADIPEDAELRKDLLEPSFWHTTLQARGEVLRLEQKRDVKHRLGRSPDRGDALAYGFYYELAPADLQSTSASNYHDPDDYGVVLL